MKNRYQATKYDSSYQWLKIAENEESRIRSLYLTFKYDEDGRAKLAAALGVPTGAVVFILTKLGLPLITLLIMTFFK